MKLIWKDMLISALMGLVLPAMVVNFCTALISERGKTPEETVSVPSSTIPMYLKEEDGTVSERDMDAYLVGVVLAEMPASFETEALKAQAVVARTYTRKAFLSGGKHGDGSVCTNPACCQGYREVQAYLEAGGSPEAVEKVTAAVQETSGLVVTYGGELIEATYFSCSGGTTEDALAVWGQDFPYLQAVESPGEEEAAYYTDTMVFTTEELGRLLNLEEGTVTFGKIQYTDGGGVDTAQIGGKIFRGTQLRSLLGLRSTAFAVTVVGERVTFTTRGYGHRVGMSQYGADAMAASGSTFREIIAHYYPGTMLTQIAD